MEMLACRKAFVAIASIKWEQMVYFYQHLTHHPPNPYQSRSYAEFHLKRLRIGLFYPQISHQSEFAHPNGAGISLCLEVNNLEQSRATLDHIYATLPSFIDSQPMNSQSMSLPSIHLSQSLSSHSSYGPIAIASHGREYYAYDPDGNRLILHESTV